MDIYINTPNDINVLLTCNPDAVQTGSFILNFSLESSSTNAMEAPLFNCPFSDTTRAFLDFVIDLILEEYAKPDGSLRLVLHLLFF